MRRASSSLAALTLFGLAGLHVVWGRGSSFPFATKLELSDAVIGSRAVPSPGACYAVAAALFAASALAADAPVAPRRVRVLGRRVVVGVLSVRGIAGLAGRTDLLSPGSASPRFRSLDRRFYSPLCLALAAGTLTSHGR